MSWRSLFLRQCARQRPAVMGAEDSHAQLGSEFGFRHDRVRGHLGGNTSEVLRAPARHQHDGQILEPWIAAQQLRELVARNVGHQDIEHDNVNVPLSDQLGDTNRTTGIEDLATPLAKQLTHQLSHNLVVINDQNARFRHSNATIRCGKHKASAKA
jgi:hypothetical protein